MNALENFLIPNKANTGQQDIFLKSTVPKTKDFTYKFRGKPRLFKGFQVFQSPDTPRGPSVREIIVSKEL